MPDEQEPKRTTPTPSREILSYEFAKGYLPTMNPKADEFQFDSEPARRGTNFLS